MRIITKKEIFDNPDVESYIATIRKNRSDVTKVNKSFNFMSVNNKTEKIDFNVDKIANVVFPHEDND